MHFQVEEAVAYIRVGGAVLTGCQGKCRMLTCSSDRRRIIVGEGGGGGGGGGGGEGPQCSTR